MLIATSGRTSGESNLHYTTMQAGLDSLGAVELRNAVASKYHITTVPATLAFDYPTASALCEFVMAHMPQPGGQSSAAVAESGGEELADRSAVSLAELLAKIATIVRNVMGAEVPALQPLMEASTSAFIAETDLH